MCLAGLGGCLAGWLAGWLCLRAAAMEWKQGFWGLSNPDQAAEYWLICSPHPNQMQQLLHQTNQPLVNRLSAARVFPRISDPLQSIVVEVKADLRTITSKTYATPYSLRFPRMTRIRCA